jgi:molecular chaperone GrpE
MSEMDEGVGDAPTPDDLEAIAEFESQLEDEVDPIADLREERDGYLDQARRVQAEFENYRKRVMREQTVIVERAGEALVESLLPVLDNFELTLANIDSAEPHIRKGIELIFADFVTVLERSGLQRIDALGQAFDPNEHEAVLQEEGGDGEPVVTDVLRSGYRLKGRVLRPAMVKVTR